MKQVEITLWVLACVIPLVLLVVVLLMKPKRPPPPTGAVPAAVNLPVQTAAIQPHVCGSSAVACNLADPSACAGCEGFVCTSVSKNDTDFNIEGTYCLPPKPASACMQIPQDPNSRMQGKLHWTGWAGVNVQDWECSCPYPKYYPMDTSVGVSSGACKRSSSLCRNGRWQYPCKRAADGTCEELSASESAALVGSDPFMNGQCSCDDVPCVDNTDCAGSCIDGVCAGQRLSMSASGLPECVVDTCGTSIACNNATTCPGSAACVGGVCQEATSVCTDDADCGPSGTCDGKCRWGKWKVNPVPPYVFGSCVCPDGYVSSGSSCVREAPPSEYCIGAWCKSDSLDENCIDGWCQV